VRISHPLGEGNSPIYLRRKRGRYFGKGDNLTKKSKGSLLETWTYGYDNLNHLVWAEDRQTDGGSLITRMDYKYDVLGNRIDLEVTANSVTTATHFAYDGQNAWADLSGTNVLQTRRLYTDAVDALFARIDSSGTVAWYLTDRLGSVRDIVNNSTGVSIDHLDYDPFGNVTQTQAGNGDRYEYTAREFDAVTKQQYNRGRYYDPGTGRWTSQDPDGFLPGDSNLYRYVGNNATNAADPTGLEEVPTSSDLNWDYYNKVEKGKYEAETAYSYDSDVTQSDPVTSDMRKCEKDIAKSTITVKKGSKFFVTFDKKRSYVEKGKETDALLQHEKLHLSIAEYTAQLATENIKEIEGKGEATEDNIKMAVAKAEAAAKRAFQKSLDKYYNKWVQFNKEVEHKYEDDTDHSRKPGPQKDWNDNWKEKVDALSPWKKK
jgi:RHS repeat-associated protein